LILAISKQLASASLRAKSEIKTRKAVNFYEGLG